jgi:hypothetical protein
MNKPLSVALFGVGGSAAIFALAVTKPFASGVSPFFGDALAGKTAWLLVAGAVMAALAQAVPARLQRLTIT